MATVGVKGLIYAAEIADFNLSNVTMINVSCDQMDQSEEHRNNNSNNNNNVNISSGEFRTISLGIQSELAKLRTAMTSVSDRPAAVQKAWNPPQRDTALDIARQITALDPEPLFVTAGNNGSDM